MGQEATVHATRYAVIHDNGPSADVHKRWLMVKINKKFGDPIEVHWLDACEVTGWRSVKEAEKIPNEVEAFSRGWYVSCNRKFVTICHSKGKSDNNDITGVLYIPRAWIIKVK